MRLTTSVFALLLLAACGQVFAGAGRPSPSPRSPSVSGVAGPTPTSAISGLPVTDLSFSCRLPFIRSVDPGRWQGGFIDFPSRSFTADPSAPPNPGYYDRAVSRFLPVGRNAVSPDGRNYAYMTGGNPSLTPGPPRLHIVNAATGAETVIALALSDQQPYGVEDYAADGIYVGSGWEGVTFGRWRVDSAHGITTDVSNQSYFADDGTGHAWVTVLDKRDPHPAPNVMGGDPMPNEVVRRDLTTGAVEIWFYHPGFNVAQAGAFIGGGLLVWVEPPLGGNHEYWLVTAPDVSRLIVHLDGGGGSLADSHGLWMGSSSGLYLFTGNGGVARVTDLPGEPANGCLSA